MAKFEYRKTPEELFEALKRQIGHLRASNAAYDAGRIEDAERIAAALYVLFEHWRNQKALVRITGVKPRLKFPDSRIYGDPRPNAREVWVGPPLCVVGTNGSYRPVGEEGEATLPRTPFSGWRNGVVFRAYSGAELTRRDVVLALGNQDGGRHVDKVLEDEAYFLLKAQGDMHIRVTDDNIPVIFSNPSWAGEGPVKVTFRAYLDEGHPKIGTSTVWPPPEDAQPVTNGHWATVRQMGWEADQAFISAGF